MAVPVSELDLPTIAAEDRRASPDDWATIDELRSRSWLARTPLGYLVTTHADATAILRDRRWHSALAVLNQLNQVDDERWLARSRPSILSVEGEDHQRLRRLVSPAFTPRSADRLRPYMHEVIDGLVDAVAPSGRCEMVRDVCEAYPIPIICELLGAPKDDWPTFSRWAGSIFKVFDADMAEHLDEIIAARDEMDAYVGALIDERRADPRDDLLSELIAAEEQGDRLSHDELLSLASAVLLAGTDTTRNQLACAVATFAEHPEQWARLAAEPELALRAAEESLRYLGAVRGTGRFASVDIEYRDVLFPRGTLVFTSFVAANHDEAAFACPHAFDITAARDATHLTLGYGLHYCLGANLARAELAEALPLLARRMPNLAIDGEVEWKPLGVGIWGPAHLPVRFDPGH
ncbi:MAG: cytochrome P450 [Acidimicrobiia bacterium]|nr:cytochrome P450 [Acidimicrobiia bacterium]